MMTNRELEDILQILDEGAKDGAIPMKYVFRIAMLVQELKGYMGIEGVWVINQKG